MGMQPPRTYADARTVLSAGYPRLVALMPDKNGGGRLWQYELDYGQTTRTGEATFEEFHKKVEDPVFTGLDECTKDTVETCIQK